MALGAQARDIAPTVITLVRRARRAPVLGYRRSAAVTIRWATAADARAVETLAALDEGEVPAGPVLVAWVADELWAALSLSTGAMVCDPFRPSVEISVLLLERARQLTVREPFVR